VTRCTTGAIARARGTAIRGVARGTALATAAGMRKTILDLAAPLPKARVRLSTGIEMAYLELGEPDGHPVVFLHGYTDTMRSFVGTLRALSALRPDLRLIAVDQRGHGATSMPPPEHRSAPERAFAIRELAADAVAFLDARGLARVTFVGHSMGSMVAQEVALSSPARVDRVALLGATASAGANAFLRDVLQDALVEGEWRRAATRLGLRWPDEVYELVPGDVDPAAGEFLAGVWVNEAGADPRHVAAILPETAATRLGTWIGALRAQRAVENLDRLPELAAPSLTIWAARDPIFLEDEQHALRAALAASASRHGVAHRHVELADPGHNLHWVEPDRVAAELAAFIAR
jgi:non-heme chloroperoxidase